MKLLEFTYTKADGTQSQRAVVEVLKPNEYYEGIDVSELDEESFASFVGDYRLLKEAQHKATLDLLNKHDLKNNYRRFLNSGIANLTSEYV